MNGCLCRKAKNLSQKELANIFSTKFIVETADSSTGKKFILVLKVSQLLENTADLILLALPSFLILIVLK